MQTKNTAGSGAMADDDADEAPILTHAEAKNVEVFEGDTFVRRGRGRPTTGNARELVSFRLDRDVLAKLREAGPGWQSQVNGMLRGALGLDSRSIAGAGGRHAAGVAEGTKAGLAVTPP